MLRFIFKLIGGKQVIGFHCFCYNFFCLSLNHKDDSFINTTTDTATIALRFEWHFGGGVKEGMDSFGHCVVEKLMTVSKHVV